MDALSTLLISPSFASDGIMSRSESTTHTSLGADDADGLTRSSSGTLGMSRAVENWLNTDQRHLNQVSPMNVNDSSNYINNCKIIHKIT